MPLGGQRLKHWATFFLVFNVWLFLGEAIQKLRETEEMLNKKQDFLGKAL